MGEGGGFLPAERTPPPGAAPPLPPKGEKGRRCHRRYSVTCLSPHCLQTYLTRVAPFSAWTRFGAPHLPQTASIRALPCLTTRAFFSIVSPLRRSASSRIACFDIGLPRHDPLRRRSYHSHDAF